MRQERDVPSFGVWASSRVAFAGQGLLGIVGLATIFRGQDALGPLFPVGVLAWAAGTVVYSVATARAAVLPRWLAPALAIGTVVAIALNPGGAIVLGALWLVLATAVLGEGRALRRWPPPRPLHESRLAAPRPLRRGFPSVGRGRSQALRPLRCYGEFACGEYVVAHLRQGDGRHRTGFDAAEPPAGKGADPCTHLHVGGRPLWPPSGPVQASPFGERAAKLTSGVPAAAVARSSGPSR